MSEEAASYRRILVVLALNAVGFAFLETAIVPALPLLQQALHGASATSSALLESAFLAVASVAAPLLGRLGDKRGKKGPLLFALVVYVFGAVNAGFSSSMWLLVPFRALQGVGGAVLALSIAILRDRAPEGRIGSGIGWIVGAFGIGIAAGFGFADEIAVGLGWRWVFWLGAMVVAIDTLLVAWLVPKSEPHPETKVDVAGAMLLAASVTCLIGAAAFGETAGWTRWFIVELFVLGGLLFAAWIAFERVKDQPLLEVRVLANPRVLLPNLGALLSGFAAFALYLVIPRFVHAPGASALGYGFQVATRDSGLYLLPVGLGVAIGGPASGAIGRRWTGKWPFVGGLALLAASALLLALAHDHPVEVVAWVFVTGLGFGASVGASAAFVAETVVPGEVGVATAFNSLMRLVGGGLGAEIAAAIFSGHLVRGHGGPDSAATVDAFQIIFWTAFALALAGAVLATFVPRVRREAHAS